MTCLLPLPNPTTYLDSILRAGAPFIASLSAAAARNVPANEGFLRDTAGNTHPPPSQSSSYQHFHRFHHQISRHFITATLHIATPLHVTQLLDAKCVVK